MQSIVLFDGDCNFCNKSVQFIIKRDPHLHFQFASLQSEIGQQLLQQVHAPQNIDSIVLIENERYYFKSSAALRICRNLNGVWKLFVILLVVPKPIRNFVYDFVAKHRYKWFGTMDQCMLPSQEDHQRFLQ